MAGFGSGPFGIEPFGDVDWEKEVLFESAPETYRVRDGDEDSAFEKYATGLAPSFRNLRGKIESVPELREPYTVRTQYDDAETIRLGPRVVARGPVEQRGVTGLIAASRALVTESGKFSFADLGKPLVVYGSSNPLNNTTVIVASVLDPTTVLTEPPLQVDAGPVSWELRGRVEEDPTVLWFEVAEGDVENIVPGWILQDGNSEFEVLGRAQFKAVEGERKTLTDREGDDATMAPGVITSPTAAFTQRDVGRTITVGGSEHSENIGRFRILTVPSATTATIEGEETTVSDAGPLVWAIRRRAEIAVRGPSLPTGAVDQWGDSASITNGVPAAFTAPSAKFSAGDVGKLVQIRAASGSANGVYEVVTVNSATEIVLDNTVALGAGSGYYWELRTASNYGDGAQVEVRPQSLLELMAGDFAIALDKREDEATQRRWVGSVHRWTNLKGTEDAYAYLGALTGFTVTASPMWRVSQEIYEGSPGTKYAVGEEEDGRAGTDGSLALVGAVRFTSPTAAFVATDVGRHIEISGSGAGNNGLYTIAVVISSTVVEFRPSDAATTPDSALGWRVVRLYASNAPLLPVYDEINSDMLSAIVGTGAFTVDKYCWEPDWSSTVDVSVLSVFPGTASAYPISYTLTGDGHWGVAVGLGVGAWKLTDAGGTEYLLETVPSLTTVFGIGRGGSDGSLTGSGPATFSAPSAVFAAGDVGKRIKVSGSGSGNDQVFEIGTYVSPTSVTLVTTDTPATPDVNNTILTWEVQAYMCTVVATEPPDVGDGSLEYLCPNLETCDYCKSNKVLIDATTPLAMEAPFERLIDRLDQVRPAHVEFVKILGVTAEAVLSLTATVETP